MKLNSKNILHITWECPDFDDPCSCGPECGWSTEMHQCEIDATTSCEECPSVCISGSCLTFEEICPVGYNPFLSCQCHDGCESFGNCCSDRHQCTDDGNGLNFINSPPPPKNYFHKN